MAGTEVWEGDMEAVEGVGVSVRFVGVGEDGEGGLVEMRVVEGGCWRMEGWGMRGRRFERGW